MKHLHLSCRWRLMAFTAVGSSKELSLCITAGRDLTRQMECFQNPGGLFYVFIWKRARRKHFKREGLLKTNLKATGWTFCLSHSKPTNQLVCCQLKELIARRYYLLGRHKMCVTIWTPQAGLELKRTHQWKDISVGFFFGSSLDAKMPPRDDKTAAPAASSLISLAAAILCKCTAALSSSWSSSVFFFPKGSLQQSLPAFVTTKRTLTGSGLGRLLGRPLH